MVVCNDAPQHRISIVPVAILVASLAIRGKLLTHPISAGVKLHHVRGSSLGLVAILERIILRYFRTSTP
jgi:hypothetical protein